MLVFPVAISACAMVSVTSDPPGAEITYSPTGTPPWRPWPPETSKALATPAWKWVRPDPYYFVRVHKDGHYSTAPLLVEAGLWRHQKLHFRLDPTPDLFARQQRERGLVLYEGQWVNPKEHDLAEYQGKWMRRAEKLKLEQEAKGLVFHETLRQWMTRQEMEKIEAEKKRKQGLVYLKGQWMPPQEADLQKLIDRQAQRIAASTATYELHIERLGPMFTPDAELRMTDLSGHPLEVLLSGPNSRRAQVLPYNGVVIQTLPGTYTLVVLQTDSRRDGLVGVGRVQMAPKNRYSTTYRGAPTRIQIPLVLPATSEQEKVSPPDRMSPEPKGAAPSVPLPPSQQGGPGTGENRPVEKPHGNSSPPAPK